MLSLHRLGAVKIVLATLIFSLVGFFATQLGGGDAISARDSQFRLLGCLFFVAGVTMIAAAVCLIHPQWRRSHGRAVAILASFAGVSIGICLLALQLGWPGRMHRVPWWVAIVLVSVIALWLAWQPTQQVQQVSEANDGHRSQP